MGRLERNASAAMLHPPDGVLIDFLVDIAFLTEPLSNRSGRGFKTFPGCVADLQLAGKALIALDAINYKALHSGDAGDLRG